jgi:cbb3-type cytochrome oxidase subunit 3
MLPSRPFLYISISFTLVRAFRAAFSSAYHINDDIISLLIHFITLFLTNMYGTSTIIKATNAVAADTRDTSHSLRETSNTMVVVWILCVSLTFFICINAWAIRAFRQRKRDQEAISAILERAESPARGPTTMGSPSTQRQFRSFQLSYQLQALSSPSTPRISPPERPTNVPGYSSNDTERNDEQHSAATGNMASSSYTPDETGEQLPKYMERDHDLPDYADQRAAPVT